MFDYKTALVISAFAIPGIAIVIPRILEKLKNTLLEKTAGKKSLPPIPVLIAVQFVQSAIVVGGISFAGVLFAFESSYRCSGHFFDIVVGILEHLLYLGQCGAGLFS